MPTLPSDHWDDSPKGGARAAESLDPAPTGWTGSLAGCWIAMWGGAAGRLPCSPFCRYVAIMALSLFLVGRVTGPIHKFLH